MPWVYEMFQNLLGGDATSSLVQEYIRPKPGDSILDIGCGPGRILEYLPSDVEYVGFDMDQEYIDAAKKKYGSRGRFECKKVGRDVIEGLQAFDIVIAVGVVHHLNDADAVQLFQLAHRALAPGQRLMTLDGCYVKGQHPIARWLLSKDRGTYIRSPEEYESIARQVFERVEVNVRHDGLRVPYTRAIITSTKD